MSTNNTILEQIARCPDRTRNPNTPPDLQSSSIFAAARAIYRENGRPRQEGFAICVLSLLYTQCCLYIPNQYGLGILRRKERSKEVRAEEVGDGETLKHVGTLSRAVHKLSDILYTSIFTSLCYLP